MTVFAILGGTGALGAALAHRLAAGGREVCIGSRDPLKAQAFAAAMKRTHVGSSVSGAGLAEAAARADLIFLTVPYAAHGETLAQIREAARGKIVVDATVPLRPPKVGTVQLPAAGAAAVEAAQLLGEDVRVVSALQNIGAEKLAAGGCVEGDVLVAADDAEAAEAVRAVLQELGLRSWYVGPLANSAAAEAMTSVLIQLNRRYKLVQAGVRIVAKADRPGRAERVTVVPVEGLPLFAPGDDLAGAIADHIPERLQDGDVIVVAQKVISKVEGRAVNLGTVCASPEALEAARRSGKDAALLELVARESQELMRVVPGVVIARHKTGQVLANAGIDASNVAPGDGATVLLWPEDPDASALRLRLALEARFGVQLAVIISDSLGRAWRLGTAGTAIGVSGIKPVRDRRGEIDLFGRTLQATAVAVADELAAAASLVIGEGAEALPVAIIRGAIYERDEAAGVSELVRPLQEDLFR